MSTNTLFDRYRELLWSLKFIVKTSQDRVIRDEPDILFTENVNFFVKSYLISTCTYLEAYLQDTAFDLARKICVRANSARIPHNFLYWQTTKEVKEKELKFAEAVFNLTKQEVSDEISANPYRTIKLFRFLGIDLTEEEGFNKNKDFINTVVVKRNNIVHHNDAANDVSFSDVEKYIDVFVDYMLAIQKAAYGTGT
ncbi:HEPN domain-containing protein [Burkholderia ubonensis]|uniref:HEPN domain-containing protein n=1 Tax=Burkholderia ubonensis TaxID=101571 RepID=UPI000A4CE9C1|nr:HEPN domain-containing protein [Burkholderia ubonensis]